MKPVLFFYEWPREKEPGWGSWVLPWRNTELSLFILSEILPSPHFDAFNPRIRWVRELDPDAFLIRLPFPNMIPIGKIGLPPTKPFSIKTRIGRYEGILLSEGEKKCPVLDGFSLYCPDPDWKELFGIQPRNPNEARLHIRALQELGEWSSFEETIPLCRFEPEMECFYRHILRWFRSRSNPKRNHCLFEDLIANHCRDAWVWLLKHFDPENPWEKQMVLSSIVVEPEESQSRNHWTEIIQEEDLLRLLTPHSYFRSKIWGKILSVVQKRENMGSILRKWPFLNLVKEFENAENGCFYQDIQGGDFVSSSVGLVPYPMNPDFLVVNVRSVNYRIQPDGSYKSFLDGKECCPYNGITENYSCLLDRETLVPLRLSWRKMENDEIPRFHQGEKAIVGIEDIRLVDRFGEVWFYAATKEFSYNDKIRIITGKYNIERGRLEKTTVIRPPSSETPCEKNWTFVEEDRFIYKWWPLQVGFLRGEKLVIETEKETPLLFQELRGSSPCRRWKNIYWTVAHAVIEDNGLRKYIHFLIALSTDDLSLIGISEPFVFEELQIEYCCGFDIYKDRFLFAYSTIDRTSRYIRLDAKTFLHKMTWLDSKKILIPA